MTLLIPSFNAKWLPLLNWGKMNMEPSEAYLAEIGRASCRERVSSPV